MVCRSHRSGLQTLGGWILVDVILNGPVRQSALRSTRVKREVEEHFYPAAISRFQANRPVDGRGREAWIASLGIEGAGIGLGNAGRLNINLAVIERELLFGDIDF